MDSLREINHCGQNLIDCALFAGRIVNAPYNGKGKVARVLEGLKSEPFHNPDSIIPQVQDAPGTGAFSLLSRTVLL